MKNKVIKLCSDKNKSKSLKLPIKDVEQVAASILQLKAETDYVANELRDHFIDLYQRGVNGLLKKILAFE